MCQTHPRWERAMGGMLAAIMATLFVVLVVMSALAFGI